MQYFRPSNAATLEQAEQLLHLIGMLTAVALPELISCRHLERLTGTPRETWFRRLQRGKLTAHIVDGTMYAKRDQVARLYPQFADVLKLPE